MKIITQRAWIIIGGAVLLAVTFYLGYIAGNKSQKNPPEVATTLSATDMEHAFGSVKPSTHETTVNEPGVMGLSGLVAGLEKKVAANPENIDQQLLLAQTYNELDNRAKSLKLLHSLNKQAPKNAQVKITLATILMTGMDKQELQEAAQLFDEAIKLKPDAANMARLYQGEIQVKLDNMAKQK
jgi:cytochrome c-type biogenesis protein CcmH/NrfG